MWVYVRGRATHNYPFHLQSTDTHPADNAEAALGAARNELRRPDKRKRPLERLKFDLSIKVANLPKSCQRAQIYKPETMLDPSRKTLLGGSWDLVSKVISPLIGVIINCKYSYALFITLVTKSHDPLSKPIRNGIQAWLTLACAVEASSLSWEMPRTIQGLT